MQLVIISEQSFRIWCIQSLSSVRVVFIHMVKSDKRGLTNDELNMRIETESGWREKSDKEGQ